MITLMFSSHNGADTLPVMLEALKKVSWPLDQLKIVAIDNASTDETSAILEKYSHDLPLHPVYCETRGKNKALNSALHLIEGELVVFTDDDVIPSANWLDELVDAASKYPHADIFGGAIGPAWPYEPPNWIIQNVPLGLVYSLTNPSLESGEIDPGFVWGPNMMCRANLFRDGNRFNESYGPSSGHYVMGSETEFTIRMSNRGCKCWFVPTAIVKHIIRSKQLKRQWILNRSIRYGRYCYKRQPSSKPVKKFFGYPRWIVRKMIESFAAGLMRGSIVGTAPSFKYQWQSYHYFGQLIESSSDKSKNDN
ncbi:MAG: glycosyltransferase [Pseudomonadales bacterium]|nr:glycosyltransferase [Pseudomonadales bacterium]